MCAETVRRDTKDERKALYDALDAYIEARVSAELKGFAPRKYSHDHDYWHSDCFLCKQDEGRYRAYWKERGVLETNDAVGYMEVDLPAGTPVWVDASFYGEVMCGRARGKVVRKNGEYHLVGLEC